MARLDPSGDDRRFLPRGEPEGPPPDGEALRGGSGPDSSRAHGDPNAFRGQPYRPSVPGFGDDLDFLREPAAPEGDPSTDAASPEDEAVAAPPERSRRARNSFVEALILVTTALVLALTLKTYVAEAYEIKGSSMLPTFRNGERVVVLKARALYSVDRGDIVIFSSTEDPTKDLIKRVVGLPGEIIRIDHGKVYVDDRPLEETYTLRSDAGLYGDPFEEELGPGEYFVLGDNRGDSHDSRKFHGVPAENIKGKVVVRWWPLDELSSF